MNQIEKDILTKRSKKIERLVYRIAIGYLIIMGIGFFVPIGFLPKSGRRIKGNFSETLPEQIGTGNYILVMIAICAIICGIILYFNKYFDLKKDLVEERTLKLSTTVEKVKYVNSDFGDPQVKVWIKPNRYDVNEVYIDVTMKDADKITRNTELELVLSVNAYVPLQFNILGRQDYGVSKEKVDEILKTIDVIKNKST